jgi:hypothetical protein
MPKEVAKPRPAPAAPPRASRVFSAKEQEHVTAEAHKLAESLGWQGAPDLVLHDIAVSDAKGFLVQKFHEIHQAALNEKIDPPTAESICLHLGITDRDDITLVEKGVAECYAHEQADAPKNPASLTPEPRLVRATAALEGTIDLALAAHSKKGG